MSSQLLTTGEVARLCGVTPDAVLKWIKKGKLPATRTPGGHYRVARADCSTLGLGESGAPGTALEANASPEAHGSLRCWEYFAPDGAPREVCRSCLVYLARAQNCYRLAELGARAGHRRTFCQTNDCQDCPYYRAGHRMATAVLVITRDEALTRKLAKEVDVGRVALRFARSGYDASVEVGATCPAVVLMDSDVAEVRDGALVEAIQLDDRVPGVRVIIACRDGDEEAVAQWRLPTIPAPFAGKQVEELAEQVSRGAASAPRDVA